MSFRSGEASQKFRKLWKFAAEPNWASKAAEKMAIMLLRPRLEGDGYNHWLVWQVLGIGPVKTKPLPLRGVNVSTKFRLRTRPTTAIRSRWHCVDVLNSERG